MLSCFLGLFVLSSVAVLIVLSGSSSARPGPVTALMGEVGAGKSGWNTHSIDELSKKQVWCPVVSTVPISLPKPWCLYLADNPGDYLAAVFVLAQLTFSAEAYRVRDAIQQQQSRSGRRKPPLMTEEEIEAFFKDAQMKYRELAKYMARRWSDRDSINALIAAHDQRILDNRLGSPLGDLFEEAKVFFDARENNKYGIADHVHGDFRFDYLEPAFHYPVVLDEVGVSASADDNEELKQSAFYIFLCQCRKLGAVIWCSGHDPSRIQKQLRELVTRFCKVFSFNLPLRLGRFYVVVGYPTPEAFLEGRQARSIQWGRVTFNALGKYPTRYIVPAWNDGSEARKKKH